MRLGPVYRNIFPELDIYGDALPTRNVSEPYFEDTAPGQRPVSILRYFRSSIQDCGCFTALQIVPKGLYDTVHVCATRLDGDLAGTFPLYVSHDLIGQTTGQVFVSVALPNQLPDLQPIVTVASNSFQAASLRLDLPLTNLPILAWCWDGSANIGTTAKPIKVVATLSTLRH